MDKVRWFFALRCAGIHFIVTVAVAVSVGVLVFGVWYPMPFREMTGGLGLYTLILGVDIVCGPLLTLILASPAKTRKTMLTDIGVVAIIQMVALGYGLYSVAIARPVALVAELDRFRVVSLTDLYEKDRQKALPQYQHTPLWGIQTAGVIRAQASEAANKNLNLSLQGVEMSMRPDLWLPYAEMKDSLNKAVKPLSALKGLSEDSEAKLTQAVSRLSIPKDKLSYLPVSAPMSDNWIVLLDKNKTIVGYANVNGW